MSVHECAGITVYLPCVDGLFYFSIFVGAQFTYLGLDALSILICFTKRQ